MNIATCISFHGTGSGAVDDFFKEFDNIPSAPSDFECRFLQDPDGVSDLEYNLIENPHRLNSGYALKRYKKLVERYSWTYRNIFGSKWNEYSEEYIESLVTEKYKGYWHYDINMLKPLPKCIYYSRRALNKFKPKKFKKPGNYNYFPNIDFWHSYISEEKFLQETRRYCTKLAELLNPEKEDVVVMDQLVATSNIKRYMRYVDNLKVIIVDRDPRDLYINCMHVKGHVLPKDPTVFAKVYRDQRLMIGDIPENLDVMRVAFEDLIYKYDETTRAIADFVGADMAHHVSPRTKFNPDISIKNTLMWTKLDGYDEAVKIIEKELPEYLYDYNSVIANGKTACK